MHVVNNFAYLGLGDDDNKHVNGSVGIHMGISGLVLGIQTNEETNSCTSHIITNNVGH